MSTRTPERGMRVAELAQLVGLSADTVRYYERAGLLPTGGRGPMDPTCGCGCGCGCC